MPPLAFLALPHCSPAPLVGLVAAVAFYHAMMLADSLTGGSAGERRERERANARRATQEKCTDDPTDDRDECCCPCRPRVRTIIPHPPHHVPRGRTGSDAADGPQTTWVTRRGGHAILDDHGSERVDLLMTKGNEKEDGGLTR